MNGFKEFSVADAENYKKYSHENDKSCENAFVNLLVWQKVYENRFFEDGKHLYIKSGSGEDGIYRLPKGDGFFEALEKIFASCYPKKPSFWAHDGERLKKFREKYGEKYIFEENRDAFDYLYKRDDLANLSGKKYHGKRNHISAFDKKYNWKYERITPENRDSVKACAEEWYKENKDRFDKYMQCERDGIYLILDNMEKLSLKGGIITVDGKTVAFTLGSPISESVFDIHIEKALSGYAEAYTVINREFAKNELSDYLYINREDDMGLEGLRKAKLSYKPQTLIKKYSCYPKGENDKEFLRKIYEEAFGDDGEFTDRLFDRCFCDCRYLCRDKKPVSMLFALPCTLENSGKTKECIYIYAAATDKNFRNKGLMKKLIASVISENKPVFLRAADESLAGFYENLGFGKICARNRTDGKIRLIPTYSFENLGEIPETDGMEYELFCINYDGRECIDFAYSME